MVARVGKAIGHDKGQPTVNAEIMQEMRELRAHLGAMEIDKWRDLEAGDVSEPEDEEQREEATPMQETPDLRYFRSILGASSRPKPEFPTYDGSLIVEHLNDWISEMDKYIEYDEIEEDKRVRLALTRLKGHASLWWDIVQVERRRKNKSLIKSWDRMVEKMRAKLFPKYYQLILYR